MDRWDAEQARRDRRSGEVVAMIFNAHRGEKMEPLTWLDIYPQHGERQVPEQSDDVMLASMQMWARIANHGAAKA